MRHFPPEPCIYLVTYVFSACRSSRFGRLQTIQCSMAGKNLYIRFCCSTGDAMGMNMVSKGVQNVLEFLQSDFPDMDVIGISGEFLFSFELGLQSIKQIRFKCIRVVGALVPSLLRTSSPGVLYSFIWATWLYFLDGNWFCTLGWSGSYFVLFVVYLFGLLIYIIDF